MVKTGGQNHLHSQSSGALLLLKPLVPVKGGEASFAWLAPLFLSFKTLFNQSRETRCESEWLPYLGKGNHLLHLKFY